LLLFDPIVGHYNLSLMSDALACSFSLVFCAAFSDLATRRISPWASGSVLLVSFNLAAGLRVEKKWILLATALVCALAWWRSRWGTTPCEPATPGRRQRLALALLLVGISVAGSSALHRHFYQPSNWMPLLESSVHARIAVGHLGEVYEALPERTRSRISREDADYYDAHVNNPPRLMQRITAGDAAVRRQMTLDIARAVLPRLWPEILFDIGRDALEDLVPTIAFNFRIGVWKLWGPKVFQTWYFSNFAVWDYQRLVMHHPRLSDAYLLTAVVVFLAALPLASIRFLSWFRESSRDELRADVSSRLPALTLWMLNAAAFAATVNSVNVRYAIIAQVVVLAGIYDAALSRLWQTPRR